MDRKELIERALRVERINADKTGEEHKEFFAKMHSLAGSPEWNALKDHMAAEIFNLSNDLNVADKGGNAEMLADIRRRQTEAKTYIKIIEIVDKARTAPFSDKKAGVTNGNQER
jgi:hypothetical protein